MANLASGSDFDARRFRPSILVGTGERNGAFLEDEWVGGTLLIGNGLRIFRMKPAPRWVMTTHPQENLRRDHQVLRTAAYHHKANVGVFAPIERGNLVRLGDPVWLEK